MNPQDIAQDGAEIKAPQRSAHKFWIAMCVDLLDHEVVGMQVRPPTPADKARHSQPPTIMWLWMLKEAAHKERKRLISGQMVRLRRGQLAVSQRYLAERANWGRKAVRQFLERLEAFDMVRLSGAQDVDQLSLNFEARKLNGIQKGPPLTVVSICNYDKYQHDASAKGPPRAQEGPRRGPGGAQNLTSIQSNTSVIRFPGTEDHDDVLFDGGQLQLINGERSEWLKHFDGDDKALDLALMQASGFIQPNSSKTIKVQARAQLARIAGYRRQAPRPGARQHKIEKIKAFEAAAFGK